MAWTEPKGVSRILKAFAYVSQAPPLHLLQSLFGNLASDTALAKEASGEELEHRLCAAAAASDPQYLSSKILYVFYMSRSLAHFAAGMGSSPSKEDVPRHLMLVCNVVSATLLEITVLVTDYLAHAAQHDAFFHQGVHGDIALTWRSTADCAARYLALGNTKSLAPTAVMKVLQQCVALVRGAFSITVCCLDQLRSGKHAQSETSARSIAESKCSHFVSLVLTVEFMMLEFQRQRQQVSPLSSTKHPVHEWVEDLSPHLVQPLLERCLSCDARGSAVALGMAATPLLGRESIVDITTHLPFSVALIDAPGPLARKFINASLERILLVDD